MGQVKFYKSGNVWYYNEGIDSLVDKTVPQGNYRRSPIDTTISISSKNSNFTLFHGEYVEVTEIQKSATPDDNYADIAEFNLATDPFFAGLSTSLQDSDGKDIDIQNPLPMDGDSVYCKDLLISVSDVGTFPDADLCNLFNDYETEISDTGSNNPSTFTLRFIRPVTSNKIGIGSKTGNFSNVKIQLKDLAGTVRTVIDDSTNDTKYTSNIYSFTINTFIEAVVEFHTIDDIKISGLFIPKSQPRNISSIDGHISKTNSTTTALPGDTGGSDHRFTGTTTDTLNYGMVVLSLKTNVASAIDGLSVQFSPDGTNWDHIDEFTIPASTGKTFSFQTAARFLRVVYTNGVVAQSYLRLQTILKPVYVKPSSHRIADSISGQDDAELAKAVITGLDPNGVFKNVKVNLEQALSTTNFLFEVARGSIPGKMFSIPGRKDSLSSTVLDDLTQIPGTTVAPEPGGIQLEIISTSVNDTLGGTGAQTIDIHYLDTNNNEQEETISMNGQTAALTTATDLDFIQWIHTKTVGGNVNGVALGNISLQGVGGGTVYEYLAAGGNQSLSGRFKVPNAKTGYVVGWQGSGITKKIDLRLRATVERFDRSLIPGIFLFQDLLLLNDTSSGWIPFEVPLKMPATAIVKMSAISSAAGGDGGGQFDILLIDN